MDRTVRTRSEQRVNSGNIRESHRVAENVPSRRTPPVISRNEIGLVSAEVENRHMPRRRVDVALPSTGAEIRLPAVPHVSNKWRILSGVLTISIFLGLILFSQASLFQVKEIQIEGLARFTDADIARAINIHGKPVFFLDPESISKDLELTYPGLSDVSVEVGWPARVRISLEERYPVMAWNWEGHVRWVDSNGVAFDPHDDGLDVVQVKSDLLPPTIKDRFVDPRIVAVVTALAPFIPDNVDLIYDPDHGLGWHDPRGWVAYFGLNDDDADQKMNVYLTLVDYLQGRGISPKMINIEFLDSPYFRMEK